LFLYDGRARTQKLDILFNMAGSRFGDLFRLRI